jgi:hypothetical protein
LICYYQEANGDYLAIETSTNDFYWTAYGKDHFEGRATCIAGLVGSVCTTAVSRGFLRQQCRRVAKEKVPAQWLQAIGY